MKSEANIHFTMQDIYIAPPPPHYDLSFFKLKINMKLKYSNFEKVHISLKGIHEGKTCNIKFCLIKNLEWFLAFDIYLIFNTDL